MLQLKYQSFELAFQYPFTTHKGTKTHQPTLITSLGLAGMTGYGEAPAISYNNVTVPDMIASLEAKRGLIERYALIDPQRFWHFLHHLIPGQHFLICALDMAGWDLFAQMRRMPLYHLLGIKWENLPVTDYTIGLDTAENMIAKVQAHPWPVYKVKVGEPNDIDKLRALRLHTDAPFRVDANEGWTFDEAKQLLPELQQLGVTLVEQPLIRTELEAMKELKALSPLPLYADESCQTEDDVKKCAEGFDGINIKLTKCGGITPAMRMIKEARSLGLRVMMGNMNESTVGTAAIATLMPLLDEADADGPLLLKQDLAEGLTYDNGHIKLANRAGLGVRFTGLRDN
ncbi:dipeptide epimerase [Flavipsychrobacter stenotrophus]|uniref:Dipeptide epimerase n=1 Tax=Flavipsychrobacter stenotrophus TaxID=2077091 RepID=A0A2S7SYJ5_9BACT|nr:dipeptide epimerase [Flavipsychrobacter stenotrophus]PQJ12023.1 dipeptide epimerase [Flavipsychrobacter stenotrophus]